MRFNVSGNFRVYKFTTYLPTYKLWGCCGCLFLNNNNNNNKLIFFFNNEEIDLDQSNSIAVYANLVMA